MIKFQIYSHFKLPITKDPLNFGKLIDQTNNKFIIQLSTKNIAVINNNEKENFVRIFKNGDLVLEFRDKFTSESSFTRYINDKRFLFENSKLISTQILSGSGLFTTFDKNKPLSVCSQELLYYDTDSLSITPLNNKIQKDYLFPI
jgi:hypothetical protein